MRYYLPSIPGGMSKGGLALFVAVLICGLFVIPCGWGVIAAIRAMLGRLRGQATHAFPGAPANPVGAFLLELATFVFCALGLLFGAVLILGYLLSREG